jgi:hypothetical protein
LTCPADAGIIRTQVTYQPLKGGGGADRIKTVFIDDMSLRASDSPSAAKPAAPPAKRKTNDPGLIFHASFDKGLDADFAKGDGRAGVQSGLECVVPDGIHGSCLRLSENGSVSYYTGGNFNAGEGALSVWINPARSQPLEKIKSLKWWAGSYFWTEFNFTDYNRFSFGMDLPKNDSGIFNTFFQTENGGVSASGERPAFRHSAVESVAGEWHHVAATWKKGGGEEGKDRRVFYFDGAPRNAVSDAALPPVVRGVMTLGCFDPSRQYYGLLDELRIYNRALTAQEIKKLSKER